MPSYCRDRRKYRGMNYEQILVFLAQEERRKRKLEEKFFKIINTVFPAKPAPISSGFTKTTVAIAPTKKQKLRFHQLLYELKRDGLVGAENSEGEAIYKITAVGLAWLKKFKERSHGELPAYTLRAPKAETVTIVSYDIPDKSKYLREWLRESLRNLGLQQMQKSVYFGKIKIPEQFLKDLVMLKLEKDVEIFEITKAGTLRHRL